MNAEYYKQFLGLEPHPEGGYYRRTYQSSTDHLFDWFQGKRPISTAIYYLLEKGDFSSFHKIKSDECWHFYAGGALHIHMVENNGKYHLKKLGSRLDEDEVFQFVVPAEAWFAVEPAPGTEYALTGCTVSPGFDFEDFTLADKNDLVAEFPEHHEIINRLCR